jgi:hypothetical protein
MATKLERQIREYMLGEINDHVDPLTGEASPTSMAEDAINALAGDNWEEWFEEDHPVWDIAIDVSEETGHGLNI